MPGKGGKNRETERLHTPIKLHETKVMKTDGISWTYTRKNNECVTALNKMCILQISTNELKMLTKQKTLNQDY